MSSSESHVPRATLPLWLGGLFAALYFLQGLAEPTDGLTAQPVRSLLKQWGRSPSEITNFVAWASLPWVLKLGFGLLTDFVPIFGSRRKSYLVLAAALCSLGMLGLFILPPSAQRARVFFVCLTLITAAVALLDVVTDAVTIEVGQPVGLTGRIQSIQWTSMLATGILAGYCGGWFSVAGRQGWAFLCTGLIGLLILFLVVMTPLPDPPDSGLGRERPKLGEAARELLAACREPSMRSAALFLVIWNLNPFTQSLLYLHMTQQLGMSEVFYGKTVTYMSITSMLASAAYGLYCHRLKIPLLVHLTVGLGVPSTLCYWFLRDEKSAIWVSCLVGFIYQTATMCQLDLAARVCPERIAGTGFALLMVVCNLSVLTSISLGGVLYERWLPRYGAIGAFNAVLVLGTALTLLSWLCIPLFQRADRAANS